MGSILNEINALHISNRLAPWLFKCGCKITQQAT